MSAGNVPYARVGNKYSDQAENSTETHNAASVQTRILIELQVISMLLHQSQGGISEDLRQLRQDVADSIT